MISSERSQNIIVAFTIILTLVSSVFLVSNARLYTGSYELLGHLDVNIVEIRVTNIDPLNESIYPRLYFTFNFQTQAQTEGNIRLTFIGADVHLNNDHLSYLGLAASIRFEDQALYANYEKNFTLSDLTGDSDRATVLDAYSLDSWQWYIIFRYGFITFDEPSSLAFRYLYFNYTGYTTIIT